MTLPDEPREPSRPGFSDALTYTFADADAAVCGIARLGIAGDGASGLVLVFRDGEPVAVRADGDAAAARRWEDVRVAGLATETVHDGRRWRLRFDGDVGFELDFTASAEPLVLGPDSPAGRAGGMEGFDHLCRVSGTVAGARFEGRGQRGRSWGAPDWDGMILARTITAWFEDERALSAVAVRPSGAASHADERVTALVLGEDGVHEVADPRISTTYDEAERQRAVGLELYVGAEDEYPARAAGEVAAGTSLDLGRLRLDCAFFRWRMHGRTGVGRYDVLRRVT